MQTYNPIELTDSHSVAAGEVCWRVCVWVKLASAMQSIFVLRNLA
jgi:hypothetical protein